MAPPSHSKVQSSLGDFELMHLPYNKASALLSVMSSEDRNAALCIAVKAFAFDAVRAALDSGAHPGEVPSDVRLGVFKSALLLRSVASALLSVMSSEDRNAALYIATQTDYASAVQAALDQGAEVSCA